MPLHSDVLVQQQILLGGQISHKHKIFLELSPMSPDYAEVYMILKKLPEWETEQDDNKVLLSIIQLFGQIDFIRSCTEITRLSMVLGDSREKFKTKGVMDELRLSRQDSKP